MGTIDTQYQTLSDRVDNLIHSHKDVQPLLATTTTHATIRELIARSQGLEEAVREIAREVEELVAADERDAASVRC